MKSLINMFALVFGFGQYQANQEVSNQYYPKNEHFYINEREVSKEVFNKTFNTTKNTNELSKIQFVKMMFSTKNIICL